MCMVGDVGLEVKPVFISLIEGYLHPIESNEDHKAKMQNSLIQLRNKMSLMFFILNALFIVIIFTLQYTNAAREGNGLAIPLPCYSETNKPLTIEPFSLIFMAIFGIALLIQFIAMFFHRMGTFLHIISSTEVNCMKLNQKEVAAMDVSDKLELVKQMQSYGDDDDTKSVTSVSSFDSLDDDSSMTTDDSPRPRRRKTVLRITKKKRRQQHNAGNLAQKFMDRYLKLADDLKNERVQHITPKRTGSNKRKKSIKKSQRAIKSVKQDKTLVLNKAQKWKNIAGIVRGSGMSTMASDHHQNDPWLSVVRGVMTHSKTSSQTSLDKTGDEEKRHGVPPPRNRKHNTDASMSKWSKLKDSFSGQLSAVAEAETPTTKPESPYDQVEIASNQTGKVVRIQADVENDLSRRSSKTSLNPSLQDHNEASMLDDAGENSSSVYEDDSVKNLHINAATGEGVEDKQIDSDCVEIEIKETNQLETPPQSPKDATTSV